MKKKPKNKHPFRPHLPVPSDVDYPKSTRPGAPLVPMLYSYLNDKSMRCAIENTCCDCGLVHHMTFEIFKASDDNWYLAKRSYRSTIATEYERKAHRYKFKPGVQKKGKKKK